MCTGAGISMPDSDTDVAAYVPESDASATCTQLGPVVRRLSHTSDIPNAVEPPAYGIKSRLLFTLSAADATWLAQYANANKTAQLALLCDGWIMNTIDATDVSNRDKPGIGVPYETQTIAMHTPVAAGLAIAIDSASSPLPQPSPTA